MLKEAILAIALSLPRPSSPAGIEPETDAAYEDRLTIIADAIAEHSKTREDAAAVLTLWYFESRFDRLIHAGLPHPIWNQDRGRARCGTQLHRSRLVPEWDAIAGIGTVETANCVRATLRVLRSASYTARARGRLESTTIARVFTVFGTGSHLPHGVAPPLWALKRAEFFDRVRARLWRAQ